MVSTGWQLPALPLRSSVVATQLSGLGLLVAVSGAGRAGLHLSPSYPWKAAALFGAIAAIAVGYVGQHHPFRRFGLANQTTTIRAMVAAMVAALVGEPATSVVAAAAIAATLVVLLLDGADGWIARRGRIASDFGARFDMEIDALLIMALALLAWQHAKAGPWVLTCGALRYAFVAIGWLLPWLRRPLPPRFRRQAICVIQIIGLTLTMAPVVTPPVSGLIAAVSLLALFYSFLIDVSWLWSRHAAADC